MFKISRNERGNRLKAEAALTPSEFQSIAKKLGHPPLSAHKIGYVAARRAEKSETVETRWNGRETTNTAHPGDWIVTNLSPLLEPLLDNEGHMNVYVIAAERFPQLYEPAEGKSGFGVVYRATGVVSALPFPGGLDIAAPWGERQTAHAGYLLCNGEEVYGSSQEAFDVTYIEA
jgi:hypothetical protein